MSRHDPKSTPRLSPRRLAGVALAVLALAAPRAEALDLRLTTENDLLVTDQDDLYTFAVALEMQRGPYTLAFRENAFTDRVAGLRFDESQVTAGRRLAGLEPWNVYAEAGLVRVGEGLFGDQAQNAVHRLIGGDEVDLPYIRSSLHGRALVTAERFVAVNERLDVGPRFELETIPGLRSHTVLGAQAVWRSSFGLTVHAVAGARLTDVSKTALERHVEPVAAVARLGFALRESIVLTWTYNEYGDGREHLSLGYRVRTGGGRTARHRSERLLAAGDRHPRDPARGGSAAGDLPPRLCVGRCAVQEVVQRAAIQQPAVQNDAAYRP